LVCNFLISSSVEKTIPCKKKISKIELFKLNEKSITFYFLTGLEFRGLIVCADNDRVLAKAGYSLLVRPEPLLIKDIKVQVNKQKPNNVRPAQMKHNSAVEDYNVLPQ
jgi:hypothetical protein